MTVGTNTANPATTDDAMTDAFDEAFEFTRGVMEQPGLLDLLPDKATLNLRTVDIQGHPIQLTAALAPGSDTWVALISKWAVRTDTPIFLRPVIDEHGFVHDQAAIMQAFQEGGDSPDTALDLLERRLRAAIAEALRFDLDVDSH